jgi:cell division protein FtsL
MKKLPVRKVRGSYLRYLLTQSRWRPYIFIFGIITLSFLHVWKYNHVMELTSEVRDLKKEKEHLTDLVIKTESEISDLSRLSRIESIAAEKLALERGKAENIYTLLEKESRKDPEDLERLYLSLKKVAKNLPMVTETRAEAQDIFKFDDEGN